MASFSEGGLVLVLLASHESERSWEFTMFRDEKCDLLVCLLATGNSECTKKLKKPILQKKCSVFWRSHFIMYHCSFLAA